MGRFVVVDQDNFVEGRGMELDKVEDPPVDRDGYRDTRDIIEEFMSAGQRLNDFRKEEFDSMSDEDIEIDITRMRGFDVAEGSMILESEAKRVNELMVKEGLEKDRENMVMEKEDIIKNNEGGQKG